MAPPGHLPALAQVRLPSAVCCPHLCPDAAALSVQLVLLFLFFCNLLFVSSLLVSLVLAENSHPALPTFAASPRKTLPLFNCSPAPAPPPPVTIFDFCPHHYLSRSVTLPLFLQQNTIPLAVPSVANPAPAELGVLAFSGYLLGAISKALILLTAIDLVWFSSQIITVSGLYKEFKFIFIQMSRWIGKLRQELDFVHLPEARPLVFLSKICTSTPVYLSGCNYHFLSLAFLIWVSLSISVMLQLPLDSVRIHTNRLSEHSLLQGPRVVLQRFICVEKL